MLQGVFVALVHTKNKCYSSGETGCEAAHKIWEFEFQVCSSLKQFRGGFERFSGAFEGIPPAAQELRGRQEGRTEEDGGKRKGEGEAKRGRGKGRGEEGRKEKEKKSQGARGKRKGRGSDRNSFRVRFF